MRRYYSKIGGMGAAGCNYSGDPSDTPQFLEFTTGITPCDTGSWHWSDWNIYYSRLKQKFGKTLAIQYCLQDMENTGDWAYIHFQGRYDCAWIKGFENEGFTSDIQSWSGYLTCLPFNTAESVGNIVENVASTGADVTKMIDKVLPILILAGAGGAIYWGYKKLNKT